MKMKFSKCSCVQWILPGLFILATPAFSDELVNYDLREFRQAFMENVSLDVEMKGSDLVGQVSRSPVYDVEFEAFPGHSDQPSYSQIRVFRVEGELVPIAVPGTDEPLDYFDRLIAPDFRLDESTADDFMKLIRAAMPESKFEEIDVERIRQRGGEWHFLAGEFFDNYSGFVVAVDQEGVISGVAYSLEL